MAALKDLMKVMEHQTAVEKRAADGILSCLEQGGKGEKTAEQWLKSGYKIVFEDMGEMPPAFFHDKKIFMLNTNMPFEEMADSVSTNGEFLEKSYARLRLCERFCGSGKQETERFGALVDKICATEEGNAVLTELANKKTFVCFSMSDGEEKATFDPKLDFIYLDRDASDEELTAAFLSCSRKALEYSNLSKKDKLKQAFKSVSQEDQNAFEKMLEIAYQTPVGKEILDQLADLKYTIQYQDLSESNSKGVCRTGGTERRILLDPKFSFESQTITFVHEATHAVQESCYRALDFSKLCAADRFKKDRAQEADACAHESLFAWQTKNLHPEIYATGLLNNKETMVAFVREMERGATEAEAMSASFKAWYSDAGLQSAYEKIHVNGICNTARMAERFNLGGHFTKSCTNADVLSGCLYEGKPYVSEDFLVSPRAFSLSDASRTTLERALSGYAERTGGVPDKSLSSMPSKEIVDSKEKILESIRYGKSQTKEMEAFVEAAVKMPEVKDLVGIHGLSVWFEKTDKGVEYMPKADTLIIDPTDFQVSLKNLKTVTDGIFEQRLDVAFSGGYSFEPSLKVSPKQEKAYLEKLVQATRVFSEQSDVLHKQAQLLHYKVAFTDVPSEKPGVSAEQNGTSRHIFIDASRPLGVLANEFSQEIKKIPERHAEDMSYVNGLISMIEKEKVPAKEPAPLKESSAQTAKETLNASPSVKTAEPDKPVTPVATAERNQRSDKNDGLLSRIKMLKRNLGRF